MEIRERLSSETKEAMKSRDQLRLDTLRFLQSAIKYREIELRPHPMSSEEVMGVVRRLINQRKESIEQYEAAGRQDLVDKEVAGLKILESFLPVQMDRFQIEKVVEESIAELKATSLKDLGPVMKAVISKTVGTADNKMVNEIVRSKLQSS